MCMQLWMGKDVPWDVTMLEDGTRYLPPGGWARHELAGFAAKRDAAWKAACAKKVGSGHFAPAYCKLPPAILATQSVRLETGAQLWTAATPLDQSNRPLLT